MIITGIATLGRDCELRTTPNGDAVTNLSLAFNYGQKGSDGKRPTMWVEAALWGKRAEALAPYLLKATKLSIVAEDPHIETFQKGDGSQGSKMVARIVNIEFAGSPQQDGGQQAQRGQQQERTQGGNQGRSQGGQQNGQQRAQGGGNQGGQREQTQQRSNTGFDDFEDSIPF